MENSLKKAVWSGLAVGAAMLALAAPALGASSELDSDADGLTDDQEISLYYTDPSVADTDGDGFLDGDEINRGFSPRHGDGSRLVDVDSDADYLIDAWELVIGTDLLNPDSDGDLYLDGTEVAASYDPLNKEPVQLAKRIEVDLTAQKLAYYFNDNLLDEFLISSGQPWTPTPVGDFSILAKYPVKHYGGVGFDYPNTKWNLHFHTIRLGYYIHGAYWHDNWGKPMSHGCVNVDYDPMERLYWWAQIGTPVSIK
jgi:hypothetical protein